MPERVVMHIDMNAFYASVAQHLNPSLQGKAVAVAGDPKRRSGIILAKSREAKACGVKTAETIWQAKQKCPELIVVPPDYAAYKRYSRLARMIYYDYTDLVEPFGLDESWIDVTGSLSLFGGNARLVANEISGRVKKRARAHGVGGNFLEQGLCQARKRHRPGRRHRGNHARQLQAGRLALLRGSALVRRGDRDGRSRQLKPEAMRKGAYLFFDEIQDVEEWGIALRRILDTEKVALYLTGSSSRLLSEDVATEFRGRSVAYELLPFSFREYLRAHNLEPQSKRELQGKETASLLVQQLKRYLVEGGFPATFNADAYERTQMLQGYAQLTVARDVVERNKLSNAAYARNLARAASRSAM